MGTFVDYYGDLHIPEEKRAEFTERVFTVFKQGGMMQDEIVRMFGKEIMLIYPPELNEEGRTWFTFNFFEDDFWEDAGYDANEGKLFSNKIGGRQFHRVVSAAYLLYEFYTDSFGIMAVDGRIIDGRRYIGWLNHLFDEQYTNVRIHDPWKIYMAMPPEVRKRPYLTAAVTSDPDITPSLAGIMKFLCHSEDGIGKYLSTEKTETRQETDRNGISAPTLVLGLRDAVHMIKESDENTEEEKLAILKQIVAAEPPKKREIDSRHMYQKTAFCAALLPAEILLIFMAKEFDLNFWELLEEMSPVMKGTEDVWDKDHPPYPPVPAVTTSDFLRCSDDDRAYFWTQNGDVHFSEGMKQWMESLRRELKEIMSGDEQLIAPKNFIRVFVETLHDANKIFRRVYCFRDMFYEFVSHSESREVQAAVILLQRLIERHREEGEAIHRFRLSDAYINPYNPSWDMIDPDIKKNPRRMAVKRYLAVMANPELRKELFGFSF